MACCVEIEDYGSIAVVCYWNIWSAEVYQIQIINRTSSGSSCGWIHFTNRVWLRSLDQGIGRGLGIKFFLLRVLSPWTSYKSQTWNQVTLVSFLYSTAGKRRKKTQFLSISQWIVEVYNSKRKWGFSALLVIGDQKKLLEMRGKETREVAEPVRLRLKNRSSARHHPISTAK